MDIEEVHLMRRTKIRKSKALVIVSAVFTIALAVVLLAPVAGGYRPGSAAPGASSAFAQVKASGKAVPVSDRAGSLDTRNALLGLQNAFRDVAKRVLPVIVKIDVTDVVKQPMYDSPFEFYFGPQEGEQPRGKPREREFKAYGLGSGVIVKRSGTTVYVLTNNHVVGEAEEIAVKLHNGKQYTARLVGKDPRKDLALVSFETTDQVPVADIGDSDRVQAGDIVFAVGNPLGFESSITQGIVSAVGRKPGPQTGVGGFTEYIQTDAAINQGNSGGALVDIDGRVVGINTWIASPSGGNVGLGFTIPINNAKGAIEDFITKGKVEYGWLGVNIGELTPEMRKDLKVGGTDGAFVYNVYRKSPADKGGVFPGDYITAINGQAVEDSTQLMFTVGSLPLDKSAGFDLIRGGERMSLTVTISRRTDEEELRKQAKHLWPGLSAAPLTEDIQKQLNLSRKAGDLVIAKVDKDGPADVAGLRPGDIVVSVNGRKVNDLLGFYKAVNAGGEITFRIYRQGNELIIGIVK
jgi:Do/DeqQ family serine protease